MQALDQDVIDNFENDGFVVIPNAIDDALVNRITEFSDKQIKSGIEESRTSQGNGATGYRNCISLDPMFVELLACKKLLPYLVRLLGADIKLLTSHLIYREPREPQNGEAVNAGWHRDFIQAQRSLGHEKITRLDIKVAFCLNDLQEDNSGGTLFIPGSHKLKEGLQIPSKKLPEGVVEPHLKKGDCVIFENRTWHAGGLNLSKNTRKVVMFGYTYTWINSYDFDSQPDSIIAKAKELYGDVGLQLLGALPSPVEFDYNYQDKPLIEWAKDNNVSTYREYNK